MRPQAHPWHLLPLILAGWINRRQHDAVEYLPTENRVLKEKLGMKRILLNDDQRRRLAVKGKILGRKMLEQLATSVTPDTILRWHRELVARHWDYSDRRRAELSTSTSWTAAFEFSSLLVLLHYLPDQLRLPLDRVGLFTRVYRQ